MAKIAREEHAAILRRVDVYGERVADVASAYGCTPANIYTILARQRRLVSEGTAAQAATTIPAEPAAPLLPAVAEPTDLFGAPAGQATAAAAPAAILPSAPKPTQPNRTAVTPRAPKAARIGFALVVRNGDGEEAVNPFRSLDELLSAAKPILRDAARSPEPVWFSIQQVDLDALDDMS